MASPQNPPVRRLVLHVDVNKTIFMQDPASGKTMEHIIESIVASSVWGRVENGQWHLVSEELSFEAPSHLGSDLFNYADYLFYPALPNKSSADISDPQELLNVNSELKQQRNELIATFTQKGKPGEKFKPFAKKLLSAVELPKGVVKALAARAASRPPTSHGEPEQKSDEDQLVELLSNGYYGIVPSFFNLLLQLAADNREFAVVFRTFGSDIPTITLDLNNFCEGTHPCYNGKNGTKLARLNGAKKTKDLRIHPQSVGVMYRSDPRDGYDGFSLVLGTTQRKSEGDSVDEFYADLVESREARVYHGSGQVYLGMMEALKKNCSLALSDDYNYWAVKGQVSSAGKILFVDTSDLTTQHIFFDDNVEHNDLFILDVRDLITGEPLPFEKVINKYVVRVDPVQVLLDPQYFVKAVHRCEKVRTHEIIRGEDVVAAEEEAVDEMTAEERAAEERRLAEEEAARKRREVPTEEYLMRSVLPVLQPALQQLEILRPTDPVAFLASYLLKHKDDVHVRES